MSSPPRRSAPPRRPPRILFLCTGNACRSQMAEGFARALLGDRVRAFSAGVAAHGLDPRAVAVMREVGVDLSSHRSKTLADLLRAEPGPFDLVVTVCADAARACPTPPPARRVLHRPFEDPPALARAAATEEEALAVYRRVRDAIAAFVEELAGELSIP